MSFIDDIDAQSNNLVLFVYNNTLGTFDDFGASTNFVSKSFVIGANSYQYLIIMQVFRGSWDGDTAANGSVSCSMDIDGTNVPIDTENIQGPENADGLGHTILGINTVAIGKIVRPQGGTLTVKMNCSVLDAEIHARASLTMIFGVV